MSAYRWVEPDCDEAAVARLETELRIGRTAAAVLVHRGFGDVDEAARFLRPDLTHLHNPSELTGMAEAVARLKRAVAGRERILLYGDYDVDGTVSIVLLKTTLRLAGVDAAFHIPHRVRDGYGMRSEMVERAAADGVTLIVSVDTGIRAGAVVEHANALGIDVIVTDHHLPDTALPPAVAVINPNRADCRYPNKDLCGAGVALQLARGLMQALGWPDEKRRKVTASLLKMVALATVADVVALKAENRAIVKLGLAGFDDIRNAGLRALLRVSGFEPGRIPSARDVGFRLGPRINAAGRMDSAEDVVELFLTEDAARAEVIARKLDQLNRERQETQERIADEIVAAYVDTGQAALVLCGEGWHHGVVGIVASRMVDKYHRPAFVIGIDPETGEARGSGRSVRGFHLLNALDSMSDVFRKFGGHAHAAGVTLHADRVGEFRVRFDGYARLMLGSDALIPQIEIDAWAGAEHINEKLALDLAQLAPFGNENPVPTIGVRGMELAAPLQLLGASGKHFRGAMRANRASFPFKAWNFGERCEELAPGRRLDVALQIEEDSFSGWSASLKDCRDAG